MEQRVSLITLGVRDVPRARRFYEQGLGWRASSISSKEVAFYQVGGMALALWGEAALAEDAAMPPPGAGRPFRGVALAHNVPNPQLVDALLAEVVRAGGRVVRDARETEWGGYSGYFADPDGHLWELAWNPGFPLDDTGALHLPE
jgi:uncharacterized protein